MSMNLSTNAAPIGIFDSGVGGLTVARELSRLLPLELLCYYGDTARVPYGTKSSETIRRYSVEITRFLKSHGAKFIVVACNTASSCAMDEIKDAFGGPVIGVVEPGVKAALQAVKNGRIGVIGTKSTIQSGSYQKCLLQHDPSLHVTAQPCPLFVPLAEEGWEKDPITLQIADRYLTPLKESHVDTVILGCTHYPLLEAVIQNVLGDSVTLVSSAEVVSKEVEKELNRLDLRSECKVYVDRFYASDDCENFKRLYEKICGESPASFSEARSEFFSLVQEIDRYKDKLDIDPMRWFDRMEA